MAAINSNMIPLGTKAPGFSLSDPEGRIYSLGELSEGKNGLLVAFICNHCPFVKHIRSRLKTLTDEILSKGIGVVGINPNDIEAFPEDSPEAMLREIEETGYNFPYLFDETQETAKAYRAACTPDFFLFDSSLSLVYRGRMDGATPGNDIPVTGEELARAADALTRGEPPIEPQYPSLGCNIKWRPGNEPDYFG